MKKFSKRDELFPDVRLDAKFKQELALTVLSAYRQPNSFSWMIWLPSLAVTACLVFFVHIYQTPTMFQAEYSTDSTNSIDSTQPSSSVVASFAEIDQEITELDFMVESDGEITDAVDFTEM